MLTLWTDSTHGSLLSRGCKMVLVSSLSLEVTFCSTCWMAGLGWGSATSLFILWVQLSCYLVLRVVKLAFWVAVCVVVWSSWCASRGRNSSCWRVPIWVGPEQKSWCRLAEPGHRQCQYLTFKASRWRLAVRVLRLCRWELRTQLHLYLGTFWCQSCARGAGAVVCFGAC